MSVYNAGVLFLARPGIRDTWKMMKVELRERLLFTSPAHPGRAGHTEVSLTVVITLFIYPNLLLVVKRGRFIRSG